MLLKLSKIGSLIVAIFTIVGAIAAALVVPEVRGFFGLDSVAEAPTSHAVIESAVESDSHNTEFDEEAWDDTNTGLENTNDCRDEDPLLDCLWQQ